MASFDSINYSLRPSKSIQRSLVFEGLSRLFSAVGIENPIYVGFGSIWFTDFIQAHKLLDIEDMVSIEANDIGFRRANFNKVYRTLRVLHGRSGTLLPEVLSIQGYCARPWIIWLDYDSALSEEIIDDMRWVIKHAPPNSIVLFTLSATQNAYGRPKQRPIRLQNLLGDVVPDELSKEDCSEEAIPNTLASLLLDFLKSEVAEVARPGGFIEAFRLAYIDSVAMVTVGGILPTIGATPAAKAEVLGGRWSAIVQDVIEAPIMTLREIAALQTELPSEELLTRDRVKELGFDLQERQIQSFQKYYKLLPSFAEIVQ